MRCIQKDTNVCAAFWKDPNQMSGIRADNGTTYSIASEEGQPPSQSLSVMEEAALVRKIDRRLIPILFMVYLAAFLDRQVILLLYSLPGGKNLLTK